MNCSSGPGFDRLDGLPDRLAVEVALQRVRAGLDLHGEVALTIRVGDGHRLRLDDDPRPDARGELVAELVLAGAWRRPGAGLGRGDLDRLEPLVADVVELVRERVLVLELDLLALGDDDRHRGGAAARDDDRARRLERRALLAERGDAQLLRRVAEERADIGADGRRRLAEGVPVRLRVLGLVPDRVQELGHARGPALDRHRCQGGPGHGEDRERQGQAPDEARAAGEAAREVA